MDRRIRIPILLGLCILVFSMGLVGCGSSVNQVGSTFGSNKDPIEVEKGNPSDESLNTRKLAMYYTEKKLLKIVQEEHDIQFKNENEMITSIWSKLQKPDNSSFIALWDQVTLTEAKIEDQTLILDMAISGELNFGSSAEGLAIQTLLQTFDQMEEIDSIQLLVNGKVQETLAGHVTINEPLSTDAVIYTGE